jgi:hypothetical protein
MSIEDKLQLLRKQWTKYPYKREAIELQVRVLKLAEKAKPTLSEFRKFEKKDEFKEMVKETLLS